MLLRRADVPLAPLTTLRLGGPAACVLTAYDEASLVDAVGEADRAGGPVLVLGGGSNVVVADGGLPGTVVHVATHGLALTPDGPQHVLLEVQAGEDWDGLVARCVADGLVGLEAMSGIPGTVGATPVQNVGAYGSDVAQTVVRVRTYDRQGGTVDELSARECRFAYRSSAFKTDPSRWVVLAVTYRLTVGRLGAPVRYAELARALGVEPGERAPLGDVRAAVLGLRRGKGMLVDDRDPDSRSAGSFFTNPVLPPDALARVVERLGDAPPGHVDADGSTKLSAAWLIERSGFGRGAFDGPVGLSGKHVLALVHRGGGTTADLLRVAREVRDRVAEVTGVELVPEPVLVGDARL